MAEDHRERTRRLLSDLGTFLRQRHHSGMPWYLDAGPAAARWPATIEGFARPAPSEPPAEPPAEVAPPASTRAASEPQNRRTSAVKSGSASGSENDTSFAEICAAFVKETLARIRTTRQAVIQADIFAAAVPAPAPASRQQKARMLAELAAEVAPCQLCKLHGGRTQTVFGTGDPDADLVFVGEAPGRDEDLQGEPFVGRAGKLLTEILRAIKLRRQDVYICNILKCRPPGNRDPEQDEVAACEPYLKRQLEILEPKIICCLGRHAAQTLLGTRASLLALRESVHFYEGVPVIVTYHPAALLRNPQWKRPTWDDVRKMRALYDALVVGAK